MSGGSRLLGSKTKPQAQLDPTRVESRGEPERLAGGSFAQAVQGRGDGAPHSIVHAGKVQIVEQIEGLEHQLQGAVLAQPDAPGQASVKGPEGGPDADIASCYERAIGGVMSIVVQLRAGEQVERTRAAVTIDGRESEIAEEFAIAAAAVRRLNQRIQHHFVPLVERRESALAAAA